MKLAPLATSKGEKMYPSKYLVAKRIRVQQIAMFVSVLVILSGASGWGRTSEVLEASLFFSGILLLTTGVLGRVWSLSYIAGHKNKVLVTHGPYSLCRNPLYLFSFLSALGLGLCTETLVLPVLIILGFILYYPWVINAEEHKLQQAFGVEYTRYCEQVPRLLPSLHGYSDIDEVVIDTKAFRKGIFELAPFIAAVGIIEFIESLHVTNMLPAYFNVY